MQTSVQIDERQAKNHQSQPAVHDTLDIGEEQPAIEETTIVSVGGGLGSYALADSLRIAGLPTTDLRIISATDTPIDTYEARVTNSGISQNDRLRSDSCSTLDNLWGFPGFAIREVFRERTLRPALQVLAEPILAEYYTPRAGDVYRSVRAEAARIGWSDMVRRGTAEWVRPHPDGGYLTSYRTPAGERSLIRSTAVHLACGAGPVRIPRDSQAFRDRNPDDQRVRHVYEPQAELHPRDDGQPLVVAVRGDGIAATQVIDTVLLLHENEQLDLRLVHMVRPNRRHYSTDNELSAPLRQAFNVPKAAWGGQLHHRLRSSLPEERVQLLRSLTETSSPARRAPAKRLRRATESGHYRKIVADVEAIDSVDDRLAVRLELPTDDNLVVCDRLVDATGLRSGVSQIPLVADLLDACSIVPTRFDRVPIESSFAATGLESGQGNVYISGSLAFGDHYGAPDTFLGLQFVAMAIHDDLARRGLVPRLATTRSVLGWLDWLRGRLR